MKGFRSYLSFLVCLALSWSMISPVASANESPTLKLLKPSFGAKVPYDGIFEIQFELEGGWAKDLSSCPIDNRFRFGGLLTSSKGEGATLEWRWDYDWEGDGKNLAFWKTEITKAGVRCTLLMNVENEGRPATGRLFRIHRTMQRTLFPDFMGEAISDWNVSMAKLELAWSIDGKFFRQQFDLAQSSAPTVTILGLERGENIYYGKNYKVKIAKPKNSPDLRVVHSHDCDSGKGEDLGNLEEITYNCTLFNRNGNLGPVKVMTEVIALAISKVGTQIYEASETVNFVKIGVPTLKLYEFDLRHTPLSKYKNNKVVLEITGKAELDERYSNEKVFANHPVEICIENNCEAVKTDTQGIFSIQRNYSIKKDTKLNVTIRSEVDGYEFWTSYLQHPKELKQGALSREVSVKVLPKPPKPLISPISITKVISPTRARWGESFSVKVSAAGKGGASCELLFQSSLSGKGVYRFRLVAGKTTTVLVTPWYFQEGSFEMGIACAPDGWPPLSPRSPRIVKLLPDVKLTR